MAQMSQMIHLEFSVFKGGYDDALRKNNNNNLNRVNNVHVCSVLAYRVSKDTKKIRRKGMF